MKLNEKEFQVISDTDFLLTKGRVIKKIETLLAETRTQLHNYVKRSEFPFPEDAHIITGKISKGENYLGLPYMVLDYPAYFQKENVFAFRTMFWWGNFFSCTLHLQGDPLNSYRQQILEHLEKLKEESFYVSVGKTPWQYHYEIDNYELVVAKHKEHILQADFLKLSRKVELGAWQKLPQKAQDSLAILLEMLK